MSIHHNFIGRKARVLRFCRLPCFPISALSFFLLLSLRTGNLQAQVGDAAGKADSAALRELFDDALTRSSAYAWLRELCEDIGPRLSGSPGAEKAVYWAEQRFRDMALDSVWLQPVMVPRWERGPLGKVALHRSGLPDQNLPACALGGSVGTAGKTLRAPVVEVFGLADLEKLGREKVEGRIVLYNRPMEPRLINTFDAYSGCVDQRSSGASEASRYGAVAVLVRSMNLRMDDLPHTGVQRYQQVSDSIPAMAISTNAAALLSQALREDPNLEVSITASCRNYPDVLSYNVIAELRGTQHPDQIVLIGAHLDSWDLGQGAQDDGAGCVQVMAVMDQWARSGKRPDHTLRAVLFMNEENGTRGALRYAEAARESGERHIAALETDRGGFSPRGFALEALPEQYGPALVRLRDWVEAMAPYGIHFADGGHAGTDIGPLKELGAVLYGLVPDSQRYFDHHHAANDRFDAVNKRELELGIAAISSWFYFLDRHGNEFRQAGDKKY